MSSPREVTKLYYPGVVRLGGEQHERKGKLHCVYDSTSQYFKIEMVDDTKLDVFISRSEAMGLYDLLEKFIYSGEGE